MLGTWTFGQPEHESSTGSDLSPINNLRLVVIGRQWWRLLTCQEVLHVVVHFSVLQKQRDEEQRLNNVSSNVKA